MAPDAFTTFAHFTFSDAMKSANSCGLLPMGSSPLAARRCVISGLFSTFTISALSLLTIAGGVPAGASTPCQAAASTPGSTPAEQAQQENVLTSALRQLFAVAEAYPDLKANQNFLDLQRSLAETEDRIAASRRFYNANVRAFNTKIQTAPSNLIANTFGFKAADYFEADDPQVRSAPQVQF